MKLSTSLQKALLASLLALVTADWQYRSRPDLTPARLNITIHDDSGPLAEGLIFVAPYPGFEVDSKGPVQPTAYIFRDNGDLVWSGLGFFAGDIANFGVDSWNGEPVLRAFQGQRAETLGRMYGYHSLLNNKYEPIKIIRGRSNKLVSAHEFRIIDEKSAIFEIGSTKPIGLGPWGGNELQDWIVSTGFQELNIETGEVIFDWESLDHIDPIDSVFTLESLPATTGVDSSHAWDYFHINSVDKDSDGNYLISGRHTKAIYKINGTSGDVIWTLGGARSSFDVDPAAEFAFQHDARLLNRSADGNIEVISLFDNSAASPEQKINPFSRARIIQLNHTDNTVKALQTYPAPDGLSAHSQGNAQVLSNKNVFVNWGQAGAVTEFSEDGKVLFHAYLDSEPDGFSVQSYRGFKTIWTGRPSESPALVAVKGNQPGEVDAYVSWNGDTEVTTWRFYAEPVQRGANGRPEQKQLLGETSRAGFETYLTLYTAYEFGEYLISAQAIDAKGVVLVNTLPVVVSEQLPGSSHPAGKSPSVHDKFVSEEL